jgi:two-component system, cell cycle response regulator DivK
MAQDTGAARTVLVVEDYADTRLMLKLMLEMDGYEVVEAGDGQQAVELAPQVLPGLILMDLNLPVLNGYEATRLIHCSAETRDIPIVAVSAQCVGEFRQRALDAGCLDCVQKPINFATLRSVVGRYWVH